MKKFNFSDWNKPLKKEESPLFNPNGRALTNSKLAQAATSKNPTTKPAYTTSKTANVAENRAGYSREGSSVTKSNPSNKPQPKNKRKEHKPAKKMRYSEFDNDIYEPSVSSTSYSAAAPAKTKSKGIFIGFIHETMTSNPLFSTEPCFLDKTHTPEEKLFLKRLKEQRNLMKVVIVRDNAKLDETQPNKEEEVFKKTGKPKIDTNRRLARFEKTYEDSMELLIGHYEFLSKLEEHNEQKEKEKKALEKKMKEPSLEPKKMGSKRQKNLPVVMPKKVEQIETHQAVESPISFPPDTVQPMDELKDQAKQAGITILNAWTFPFKKITRHSRQFDAAGTCLYCKTHAINVQNPHENCPYLKCSCIECLKFDSNQAIEDYSQGPDPEPWELSEEERQEIKAILDFIPSPPTMPMQMFILPDDNASAQVQSPYGFLRKSPVLPMF